MLTRRELLIGGAAAIVASTVGRLAWGATAPAASRAATTSPLDEIMGESPAIVAFRDSLRALLDRAAGLSRPPLVLLLGETGVGKSLAANVLHRAGPRRVAPYVWHHLAAIPEDLLEAELYGYVPNGSTTGQGSPGVWEQAAGGSVYLDGISLLSAGRWPKLVRTMQTGTVKRIGSRRGVKIDAWTIMSTSASLDTRVGRRTLRDRIARLDPATLTVPSLRKRGDDVQLLADRFLARACNEFGIPMKALTRDARRALGRYVWPGNVRELANMMERAVLLSEHREMGAEELGLPT